MNGIELASTFRANSFLANIPIIFLTGNSSVDSVMGAKYVGANDFIIKPVNRDVLVEKVSRLIGG
jgi:two-component system sensor histidine kinase/response regulator